MRLSKERSGVALLAAVWTIFFVCAVATQSPGQNGIGRDLYRTSAGLRLGGTSGVTVKHFYRETMAWEGILGTFGNGFSVTALLEKHLPFEGAQGLRFYYGGGAHLAFYEGPASRGSFGREVDYRSGNDMGIGINGVIGLEYRLPDNIPIAISIDLKPFIEVGTGGRVAAAPDPSFGIKFIFP